MNLIRYSLLLSLFFLSSCSTVEGFKKDVNRLVHMTSQRQIEPNHKTINKVQPRPKKSQISVPHTCDYIVRDLSVMNASAVFCIPRGRR